MKLKSLIAAVAILTGFAAWGAESASTVMQRTAAKFNAAKSLTVKYVVKTDDGSADGTMTVAGNRFMADSPQMKIWFDGKTQWTWAEQNDEVNITEPELDELMESNPFAILNNFANYYRCRLLPAAKSTDRVELIPKDSDSSIRKSVVTINRTTSWPERIEIEFDNGTRADVAVSSITVGKALNDSKFRYNGKAFPAKRVVDLR